MLQIKVPFLPMSAWLPKVVEPSKQQVLAAVFFLILYPYYLIRGRSRYFEMQPQKGSCVRDVDNVFDGAIPSSLILVAIVWCFYFF